VWIVSNPGAVSIVVGIGANGRRGRILSPEEKAVQDFGHDLFNALFSGEVRDRCDVSLDCAWQGGGSMAKRKHLKILRQQVAVWNRWRVENPDVRPDLGGAILYEADLSGAILTWANLRGANLRGANLRETDLRETDLSEANVSEADLREANLREADLRGANLRGANLRGVKLIRADLSETDLSKAHLSKAHLTWANLREANLREANLRKAYLRGADLRKADLRGTDLSEADLSEADLSEAIARGTIFADLDLSGAKGLETVRHEGPSTIGIDTIYRSGGKISEAFMRGAGVPDTFIAYITSLTREAIQYYSCFISYSTKDEGFAQRLHNNLQGKGVRCWFAPEDIRGGEKLFDQIDQAIRFHDKLLLVLSEHSIHSEWVTTEIRRARKAELHDGRRKLFPIRLVDWETIQDWECFDADTGKDLAVEVREYFVPDFSHWKHHDSYQRAFEHLLRDLKASEA
jgi:uncharacterized protein YjbI with pentapeptide repeats